MRCCYLLPKCRGTIKLFFTYSSKKVAQAAIASYSTAWCVNPMRGSHSVKRILSGYYNKIHDNSEY